MQSYNLWNRPWIDTDQGRLSIRDVLVRSGRVRWVLGGTPLETAGLLRLLVAIAQDIARPGSERDIYELLARDTFDGPDLAHFERDYAGRFDLFGERPFMQAVADDILSQLQTARDYKAKFLDTVARLVPDIPTGSSVARNGERDKHHLFCPACAARALLVPGPFFGPGGNGLAKSINGVPPLYAFPAGETLHETLVKSLVLDFPFGIGYDDPFVPWRYNGLRKKEQTVEKPSLLHGLMFLPRRIRLYLEVPGHCTRCGQVSDDGVVQLIHFSMGERFSMGDDKASFDDPFIVRRTRTTKTKAWTTPVIPGDVRTWHELMLGMVMGDQSAAMFRWPDHEKWLFVGSGTNQAKYKYWFGEQVTRPAKNLADGLLFADALIAFASRMCARASLPDGKPAEITKKTQRLSSEWWGMAYRPFQPILADSRPENMIEWEQALVDLILDQSYSKSRQHVAPDEAARQELALMAWVRDNRKWYVPEERTEFEPGVGRILRQRGMKPDAFARLLSASQAEVRLTLSQYGIDVADEKIEKLIAAWNSPREFTQRTWMRDYFHQPKKEKGE